MNNKIDHVLVERYENFQNFVNESKYVLNDFFSRIGLPRTDASGFEYEECAATLGEWLKVQEITIEGRPWISTVSGYFIGEYFISKYGGRWAVNEIIGSRIYGRYVINDFTNFENKSLMLDPFGAAIDYINAPPGRDLLALIRKIESNLSFKSN